MMERLLRDKPFFRDDGGVTISGGECSDYNSKNSVYSDIIQQITKLNPDFSIYSIMENIEITNEEQEEIRNNYINKEINKGIKNENKRRKEKEKNILTEDEKNKMSVKKQNFPLRLPNITLLPRTR